MRHDKIGAALATLLSVVLAATAPPSPFSIGSLAVAIVVGSGLAQAIVRKEANARAGALVAVGIGVVMAPPSSSVIWTGAWVLSALAALEWTTRDPRDRAFTPTITLLGLAALVAIGPSVALPNVFDVKSPVFAVSSAVLLVAVAIASSRLRPNSSEEERRA